MKFVDKIVFQKERFSVGMEETTGACYISIPVANPYVEYAEYYRIDREQYEKCPSNLPELMEIVLKSRARKNDSQLIVKPGRMRGSPT